MKNNFHRDLEEAALAAWPAEATTFYDGWLLRNSNGYTKRANSASPMFPGTLPVEEKISFVETFYRNHRLPPIFRLTPFASTALDGILASKNYSHLDPTFVLACKPITNSDNFRPGISLKPANRDEWLDTFSEFSFAQPDSRQKHGEILERIDSPAFYGLLNMGGKTVACGLVVEHNGLVGLFDLTTSPVERRRGYGIQLILGLSNWARTLGANHLYLQVMESNLPARKLYQQMGFQFQYQYWYRKSGS